MARTGTWQRTALLTALAFLVGILVNPIGSGAADSQDPFVAPVPIPEYIDDDLSFLAEVIYTGPNTVTKGAVKVVRGSPPPYHMEAPQNSLTLLAGGSVLNTTTLQDPSQGLLEGSQIPDGIPGGGFSFQSGKKFVYAPYNPTATTLELRDLQPPALLASFDLSQALIDFCTLNKTDPTCTRDLRAGLTDAPDPVFAGNDLTYTATLANDGPNPAFNAELDIDLPAGLTVDSPPAGCTAQPDGDMTCTAAKLNSGAQQVFVLVVNVPSGFLNGNNGASKSVTATATASSTVGSDTDATDDIATTNTLVKAEAKLSLTKACPARVIPGSEYSCTIIVTNAGPSDADKVVLTDDLPANVSVIGTPSGGGFSCTKAATSPELTCTHAPIKPGATHTLTVTFLLDDDLLPGAVLTNTAAVKSVTADPVPANNQASRTGKVPECERTGSFLGGTAADEVLCGTPGRDNIHGQGGNDLIFGFGDNDNLTGGAGNDHLFGGTGDDELSGADGNDRLFGNAGNDDLQGAAGTDHGVGGTGTDSCTSIESGGC